MPRIYGRDTWLIVGTVDSVWDSSYNCCGFALFRAAVSTLRLWCNHTSGSISSPSGCCLVFNAAYTLKWNLRAPQLNCGLKILRCHSAYRLRCGRPPYSSSSRFWLFLERPYPLPTRPIQFLHLYRPGLYELSDYNLSASSQIPIRQLWNETGPTAAQMLIPLSPCLSSLICHVIFELVVDKMWSSYMLQHYPLHSCDTASQVCQHNWLQESHSQYIGTLACLLYVFLSNCFSSGSTYIFKGTDSIAEGYTEIFLFNRNELTRLLEPWTRPRVRYAGMDYATALLFLVIQGHSRNATFTEMPHVHVKIHPRTIYSTLIIMG